MKLTPVDFQELSSWLLKSCGLSIGPEKEYLVLTRLEPILEERGWTTFSSLNSAIKFNNDMGLRQQVIDAMTTQETSFFRDTHPFEMLRTNLLNRLYDMVWQRSAGSAFGPGKLRIWSAACSTGQEPYSLAITLWNDWQVRRQQKSLAATAPLPATVLATDISLEALEIAKQGAYPSREIDRGLNRQQCDAYFQPEAGGGFRVQSFLKSMIEFRQLNLLTKSSFPASQDLILCRNVLIYFTEQQRQETISNLVQSLVPGGYLILGAIENFQPRDHHLVSEQIGRSICYRRKA
jgi:chemotaxis protein methyltransferase CheR